MRRGSAGSPVPGRPDRIRTQRDHLERAALERHRFGTRLLVDGRDVAPIEMAAGFGARGRGLLGRDGVDGALLLGTTSSVHTVGMRFPIDVAFCSIEWRVDAVQTMGPGRVSRPRLRARRVIEAEAGAFERWGLRPGSVLATAAAGGH